MQGPQLEVRATEDGILISLTDRQNFSMFAIGSAEPQPRVVQDDGRHRREPAKAAGRRSSCAATPTPVPTGPRLMTIGGCHRRGRKWPITCSFAAASPEKRFERVEGYADHRLKDPSHPLAAENRRIEILVREAKP